MHALIEQGVAIEQASNDAIGARKQAEQSATKPMSPTVHLRCAASIKPLPITWLWPGWLPIGKLTILAGATGSGKTTLALGLAGVLTSGGIWPDGSRCDERGNVLIWASEDNLADTLMPRLIASGADTARCYFIPSSTEDGVRAPFDPAQHMRALHQEVERIGGVSLLIIDPITSAVSGDLHRANDWRRSLQAIVDFAEVYKCAVIGIADLAKGEAGKLQEDREIGLQAYGALASMVFVAAKAEEGDQRVLARVRSNIAPDTGDLSYRLAPITTPENIATVRVVWKDIIKGTARKILGQVERDGCDEGEPMALEIPGKLPSTANGKIAVKAAWQIECESGRRASGEEVMARLQHWADNGDEPGVLIRSNKKKRYVVWLTQKYEERDYSLEACQKTVERWNESREEPTLDRH